VDLFQPRAGDTALQDAVVLLGVDVERLLVDGRVLVDLVDGGLTRPNVRGDRVAGGVEIRVVPSAFMKSVGRGWPWAGGPRQVGPERWGRVVLGTTLGVEGMAVERVRLGGWEICEMSVCERWWSWWSSAEAKMLTVQMIHCDWMGLCVLVGQCGARASEPVRETDRRHVSARLPLCSRIRLRHDGPSTERHHLRPLRSVCPYYRPHVRIHNGSNVPAWQEKRQLSRKSNSVAPAPLSGCQTGKHVAVTCCLEHA
jgi:hypothetical protein